MTTGLDVRFSTEPLGFAYGPGVFGPEAEFRRLDAVRSSLLEPECDGPDPVYAIAMDIGKLEHRADLENRMLLFGVVAFAAGRLGREPVRSQGHVHRVARHSGWAPPEVFEIWRGRAIVYMQESAAANPGRCYAVQAGAGEVVVVPPGWAHAAVSADPVEPLVFGALCDREYGFEYSQVRERGGLAWLPVVDDGMFEWHANRRYQPSELIIKRPGSYDTLGLSPGVPLYTQFERNPDSMQWVSDPARAATVWTGFVP